MRSPCHARFPVWLLEGLPPAPAARIPGSSHLPRPVLRTPTRGRWRARRAFPSPLRGGVRGGGVLHMRLPRHARFPVWLLEGPHPRLRREYRGRVTCLDQSFGPPQGGGRRTWGRRAAEDRRSLIVCATSRPPVRWACRQAAPSPGETPMRPACHDPGFGVIPDRATGTANPAPHPSRDGRCAPGSP